LFLIKIPMLMFVSVSVMVSGFLFASLCKYTHNVYTMQVNRQLFSLKTFINIRS